MQVSLPITALILAVAGGVISVVIWLTDLTCRVERLEDEARSHKGGSNG